MGYQEVMIKSNKISAEEIARIISEKRDPLYIDEVNFIAILKQNIDHNKIRMFGKEINISPIRLQKGEEFAVVTGERSALSTASIKSMFPILVQKTIQIYPLDNIVLKNDENYQYDNLFSDKKIEAYQELSEKQPEKKVGKNISIRERLKNFAQITAQTSHSEQKIKEKQTPEL